MRKVGLLIFDDVEVLDFCGPFEVFSVTGARQDQPPFDVFTVAEKSPISARNGLKVLPTYVFETCPQADLLVVPGGGGRRDDGTPYGTRREMHNEVLLDWLRAQAPGTERILSVCTGALLLARAGVAENVAATTHHHAFDDLRQAGPTLDVREGERVVDSGQIIFSAGISAGIDAAFYLVSSLLGSEVAQETAEYMEYDWRPNSA